MRLLSSPSIAVDVGQAVGRHKERVSDHSNLRVADHHSVLRDEGTSGDEEGEPLDDEV